MVKLHFPVMSEGNSVPVSALGWNTAAVHSPLAGKEKSCGTDGAEYTGGGMGGGLLVCMPNVSMGEVLLFVYVCPWVGGVGV